MRSSDRIGSTERIAKAIVNPVRNRSCQPLRVSAGHSPYGIRNYRVRLQISQTELTVKTSSASLKHLLDTVRYAAQSYKVETGEDLGTSEDFNEPSYPLASFTLPQVAGAFEISPRCRQLSVWADRKCTRRKQPGWEMLSTPGGVLVSLTGLLPFVSIKKI